MTDEEYNNKEQMNLSLSNFTSEEFDTIIKNTKNLLAKEYIIGINFIQSKKPLPTSSIIIHFLHDNEEHIDNVSKKIKIKHFIVPRLAY